MKLFFDTPLNWETRPVTGVQPPVMVFRPWARPVQIVFDPDIWPDEEAKLSLFSVIMAREHGLWTVCPKGGRGKKLIQDRVRALLPALRKGRKQKEKRWLRDSEAEVIKAISKLFVLLCIYQWMKDWEIPQFDIRGHGLEGLKKEVRQHGSFSPFFLNALDWAWGRLPKASSIYSIFESVAHPLPAVADWPDRIERLTEAVITEWIEYKSRFEKAGLVRRGRKSTGYNGRDQIDNRGFHLDIVREEIDAEARDLRIPWLDNRSPVAVLPVGHRLQIHGKRLRWSRPRLMLTNPPRLYPAVHRFEVSSQEEGESIYNRLSDIGIILDVSGSLGDPEKPDTFARALLKAFFRIMKDAGPGRRLAALVFASESRYSGWQTSAGLDLVRQTLLLSPGSDRTFLSPTDLSVLVDGARQKGLFLLATDGRIGRNDEEIRRNIQSLVPVLEDITHKHELILVLVGEKEHVSLELAEAVRNSRGRVLVIEQSSEVMTTLFKMKF